MEWILTLDNMAETANAFWQAHEDRRVFAFQGEMGSGKTTFIHALCDSKKVSSPVGSPTFSIINEYACPEGRIFHIDLYRLKDEEEAVRAGIEDCLYSGDICLVEWPSVAPALFPKGTVTVSLTILDPHSRKIHADLLS
jgi:tRNA threonylcarbamoyladenosine biosynthesis protein TsaE